MFLQDLLKTSVETERGKADELVDSALEKTKNQMDEYIKEQKQVRRQCSLKEFGNDISFDSYVSHVMYLRLI